MQVNAKFTKIELPVKQCKIVLAQNGSECYIHPFACIEWKWEVNGRRIFANVDFAHVWLGPKKKFSISQQRAVFL